MKVFIERIALFPEKREDGFWSKKIVFNFPGISIEVYKCKKNSTINLWKLQQKMLT